MDAVMKDIRNKLWWLFFASKNLKNKIRLERLLLEIRTKDFFVPYELRRIFLKRGGG